MFKDIRVHANFNERTGYGVHASRFFPKLIDLVEKYQGEKDGEVHISLLDVVTASQTEARYSSPSILFTVWESTEYPAAFMEKLKNYDQLWVPSKWQKDCSVAQGIPEEFVKVVPEGVDPDVYKPLDLEWLMKFPRVDDYPLAQSFNFLHIGQWQPRKSTLEIIQSFLEAFPDNPNVRLQLSVDTLFPSDTYKTTEERLVANGINDSRISVIHFEERSEYVRRLQSAHCFVSCARSEGWGLPLIEAMATGIPAITSDFGGSTEYHDGAIRVPISKLIKPFGIYGNWDVPGKWAEPDYNELTKSMKYVYDFYSTCKERALKTSDIIRDKFSWDSAANKAFQVLEELSRRNVTKRNDTVTGVTDSEAEVRRFASKHGFEIVQMKKSSACFVIGTWPDSPEKVETLIETIGQVKSYGYPVIISTHYVIPKEVVDLVDYVIYEKNNILSGDWTPEYTRPDLKGSIESKRSSNPYHGVACLNAIRNAIDFARGKFSRINYLEYDCEVDLQEFMDKVGGNELPFTAVDYEDGNGIRTDIWSGLASFLDPYIPHINSWEEYASKCNDLDKQYPLEKWLMARMKENGVDDLINVVKIPVGNRYDQVDRNIWADDLFYYHFIDGAFLHIVGLSNKVYDVDFINLKTNDVEYSLKQKAGMWAKPNPKYFVPWKIQAKLDGEVKFNHILDLKGKRVLISLGSKALGDTIAWTPYLDEFRKKYECEVIASGWWQEIFDYPEIIFVKPGDRVENIHCGFAVGCFDNQPDKNPENWRSVPLQKVAADILGLDYHPVKAKFKEFPFWEKTAFVRKTVCFSEFSTMRNKLWNREGAWQKIIDYLNSIGYDPVSVSMEPSQLQGIVCHNGQSIQQTIQDIQNCDFYIGLNHGPAWIAYTLGKPVIMISGVSQEWNDFPNPYRISVDTGCEPCFNNTKIEIERGWEWCVNEDKYICTRNITETMVISMIERVREDLKNASSISETKNDDGDSGTPSVEAIQKEQGCAQNE